MSESSVTTTQTAMEHVRQRAHTISPARARNEASPARPTPSQQSTLAAKSREHVQLGKPSSTATAKATAPPHPLRNALATDSDVVFDSSVPQSPKTRHKDYPLYDYQHIPQWLEGNPFIQSYYRCGYSTAKCFQSIFTLHNETFNIWTHIVGFFIAFAIALHVMCQMELGRKRDFLVFSLLELGSFFMLGGSSVYHTLAAHYSARVHNCALAFDYFGITVMIIGSFYPTVFYLFSCSKEMRFAYFTVMTTLGVVSLLGPTIWPLFNTDRFYYVRLVLFVGMAVIGGLLPGLHVMYALPTNEYTTPVYNGIHLFLALYAVGMVLYLFQIPERFFPGKFDLVLSSHQLWHFFVLSAAVVQYFTAISAFQLWRVTGEAGGECV